MDKLIVNNLSFSYDKKNITLDNISFSIKKNKTIGIVGANGSGKSTLLQILIGSIEPLHGDIMIDDISIMKNKKLGQEKTGMVFQEPENQLFMPVVWEDVAFGILKKGKPLADAKEEALKILDLLEAGDLAERAPYTLSHGEKQKAAIATVLVMKPEILLLDEPTASLDPRARKNIITLLENLVCTKIIATHDLDMAIDICDEVLFLDKGKIAGASDVPGLLYDEAFLQSIGLELPLSFKK